MDQGTGAGEMGWNEEREPVGVGSRGADGETGTQNETVLVRINCRGS